MSDGLWTEPDASVHPFYRLLVAVCLSSVCAASCIVQTHSWAKNEPLLAET